MQDGLPGMCVTCSTFLLLRQIAGIHVCRHTDGAAAVCADMFGEQTCIKQGNNNNNNYSICVALFVVFKVLKQTCIKQGKGV